MGCFLNCFGAKKERRRRKPNKREQLGFGTRKKVTFDLNVKTYEETSTHEIRDYESEEEKESEDKKEERDESSIISVVGSFPSNHRYQNCSNSDDEYKVESEESELDDDEDDYYDDDDEDDKSTRLCKMSLRVLFSLPSAAIKRHGSETPLAEKEVNSPLPLSRHRPEEMKTLSSNQNTFEIEANMSIQF
ncbi:hypothetical protein IFM89_009049 [Coptis chinensis]|uniref:Uncharacterized protein n=1 Tax=Coptis chinensis TaxID=261450 RepID=A0A835M9H2_9MAGN|nr:hypothetical protein IFM89_009049 [Coptis chinensis]